LNPAEINKIKGFFWLKVPLFGTNWTPVSNLIFEVGFDLFCVEPAVAVETFLSIELGSSTLARRYSFVISQATCRLYSRGQVRESQSPSAFVPPVCCLELVIPRRSRLRDH